MNRLFVLAMGLALASVAHAGEPKLYLVNALATQSDNAQARATAGELEEIYNDLAGEAGVNAVLVWSTAPDINAFATVVGEDKIVVVQEGLLDTFGGDRDAVAAVLGHELAHHKADHIREGKRKREGVQVLGAILGAVVGAKVGNDSGELAGALAGSAVGVGAGLLVLKFSRNQELEADRLAVGWMIATGYNPNGMLRLQQGLGEMSGKKSKASILSTHPTSKKRYAAAEKQIAKLNPQPELLARSVDPLVNDQSISQAKSAIKAVQDEALASALAPVEGVSLENYASLLHRIMYAAADDRQSLLARNNLDGAKYLRVHETYNSRLRQNPALTDRFLAAYYKASEGKLAAWGQDIAQSYDSGEALKREPPRTWEVTRQAQQQMRSRNDATFDESTLKAAEREILVPHGLSFYDFQMCLGWWKRKAELAALAGDSSLLEEFEAARTGPISSAENAEASGVKIGSSVKIGKNVNIGGKPVTTKSDPPTD